MNNVCTNMPFSPFSCQGTSQISPASRFETLSFERPLEVFIVLGLAVSGQCVAMDTTAMHNFTCCDSILHYVTKFMFMFNYLHANGYPILCQPYNVLKFVIRF